MAHALAICADVYPATLGSGGGAAGFAGAAGAAGAAVAAGGTGAAVAGAAGVVFAGVRVVGAEDGATTRSMSRFARVSASRRADVRAALPAEADVLVVAELGWTEIPKAAAPALVTHRAPTAARRVSKAPGTRGNRR